MNKTQKNILKQFFEVSQKLKDEKIIRSSKYSGDIAEFVCSKLYSIRLNTSGREEGYDGIDCNGKKVEIKFHDGSVGTNINMDKYKREVKFDYLLVMLGCSSKIRPDNVPKDTYPIYKIDNYERGKNIAKTYLSEYKFDKLLNQNFDELNIE